MSISERFSSFLPQHALTRSLSGCIEERLAVILRQTEVKLRLVLFFLPLLSTIGSRRDLKISHLGLSNAGKNIAKAALLTAISLLKPNKSPLRQTAHDRALEFPCSTFCCFLSPVNAVAKHLCHDFIAAQKMNLKAMRLFLRTSFCVDAADVRFRLGVRASSHEDKLTRS